MKNETVADIGVDDVIFSTKSCGTSSGCDFEHDMCSWMNAVTDSVDWLLQSPQDALPGPTTDHSTSSISGREGGLIMRVTEYFYKIIDF